MVKKVKPRIKNALQKAKWRAKRKGIGETENDTNKELAEEKTRKRRL